MRLLTTLLGAAFTYYGAILVLGACKVSPNTLNDISAYRTVFRQLASITSADISGRDRLITAIAGVVCFLVFAALAWRALPRPYISNSSVELSDDGARGHTEVGRRVFERLGESAATRDPAVIRASARYRAEALDVEVQLASGRHLSADLSDVQARVRDAVTAHGLPDRIVNVTFAGTASSSKGDPA